MSFLQKLNSGEGLGCRQLSRYWDFASQRAWVCLLLFVCRTRQTEDRLLTWVGMRLRANSEISC